MTTTNLTVRLRRPHHKQQQFVESECKRIIIRAGRRSGKTVGIAIKAVKKFLAGRRVLYAAPTQDQIDTFWGEVKRALAEPLERGIFYKNETRHIIERSGTQQRIRAKTAWNADSLRGDYADELILDEFQLMNEDTWTRVGAPMLLDNGGNATFIYTPPSLHSRSVTKARDPQHAAKMFEMAEKNPKWETYHFTSHDNPHLDRQALEDIAGDMTELAYQQEILAKDVDEAPGALWTREIIERNRVAEPPPLVRIGIGVDPPGSTGECGIVIGGIAKIDDVIHGYVLDDATVGGKPAIWADRVVGCYGMYEANLVIVEVNFGGDMVERTIRTVPGGKDITIKQVRASRGKAVRAEPVSALYQKGRIHHVEALEKLENELCLWQPNSGMASPNRLDALVWLFVELMKAQGSWGF